MSLQIASYEAQKNNLSRKVTVVPSFEIGVRIPVPSESFSLNRCRNRNSKKCCRNGCFAWDSRIR